MLIDCDTCQVRDLACGDCVVTVLLGQSTVHTSQGREPPDGSHPDLVEFDQAEQAALAVLASSGLVPPLRLVPGADDSPGDTPRATSKDGDGRVKRRATG